MPAERRTVWYRYALVRVVPRVERGESLNVGVVLFAPEAAFLRARITLDDALLAMFAPDISRADLERRLSMLIGVADGDEACGAVASLPQSDRFHWLTSPRSTVIQPGPVHVGCTSDPASELEQLLDHFVRRAGASADEAPTVPRDAQQKGVA